MARRDLTVAELRCLYTLSAAQLGQLLNRTPEFIRDHLVDEDGAEVRWTDPDRDVNRPVFLSLPGLGVRVPVHRDTNGDVMFLTAECDEAFAASSRQIHPDEKPLDLMRELVSKCPLGVIADPFTVDPYPNRHRTA